METSQVEPAICAPKKIMTGHKQGRLGHLCILSGNSFDFVEIGRCVSVYESNPAAQAADMTVGSHHQSLSDPAQ